MVNEYDTSPPRGYHPKALSVGFFISVVSEELHSTNHALSRSTAMYACFALPVSAWGGGGRGAIQLHPVSVVYMVGLHHSLRCVEVGFNAVGRCD